MFVRSCDGSVVGTMAACRAINAARQVLRTGFAGRAGSGRSWPRLARPRALARAAAGEKSRGCNCVNVTLAVPALCALLVGLSWFGAGPVRAGDEAARVKAGHLVGHGGPIRALAADPASGRILSGSFDYSMMLWQVDTDGRGRQIRRFDDHDGAVSAVAFHTDGRHGWAGSDDGKVHLWDLESGKLAYRFDGHTAKILGLAVTSDGRRIASASWDHTVRVWDVAERRLVFELKGHTGPVNAVAFTVDGRMLLSAAYDGTLRLWDMKSGDLKRVAYKHGWGINVLQRVGAGNQFLFGGLDGTAAIYDLGSGDISEKLKAHEKPVLALAVLDKPGLVATGGGGGEIRVYRQGDWALLESYTNPLGPVWAMAFVDRGARLYFGSLDDFAIAWQVSPRKPFETVPSKFPRRFQVSKNISLGERQFARKCSICHTLRPDDANRAGPTLYGVFGRPAGTLPGYPYSRALKSLKIVWTEETIAKLFELGPDDYTPGSKMPLQRINDKAKRDALISFLKQRTEPDTGGDAGGKAGERR